MPAQPSATPAVRSDLALCRLVARLTHFFPFATPLLLTACASSTFSQLPETAYARSEVESDAVRDITLSRPVTACGTRFPEGTKLHFDAGIEQGLSLATLSAPAEVDGHNYAAGTKLRFLSTPKKLFAAETCELHAVDLANDDTFGPNRFGAGDVLFNYRSRTFHSARLGDARTFAGKSYGRDYELRFDDAGAVAEARSPTQLAEGRASANAAQKAADDKRAACNNRCAPLQAAPRADCLNACLR